jgi:hypothetical protein
MLDNGRSGGGPAAKLARKANDSYHAALPPLAAPR